MTGQQIADELRRQAAEMGFAHIAFGQARPLEAARGRLRERIAKGFLGHYGFTAGAQERFCHPETLLPGARTVIACALSYLRRDESPATLPTAGFVARFARGRDYHRVMQEKMQELAARLQQLAPECSMRLLVDTGPLMDRAAAEDCGLGSFGRNACLYVGEAGSWVVLGEIITDVEIPPDALPAAGEPDPCGSCHRCQEACPTGAIAAPYEVDLNRCLSHLTQMGGIIPRHLRPLLGNRVYGCDTCQEVCPRNNRARPGQTGDFEPGPLPAAPDLIGLLEMTNEQFRQSLARSAAGWIGRNRLRRNACVALGNLRTREAVPALCSALLKERAAIVRAHAAWALGEIGGEEALRALTIRRRWETDPDAAAEIEAALKRFSDGPSPDA